MDAIKNNKSVSLNLSSNEALVLLDWLTKFNQKENSTLYEDQAEERVLFDLEASLEKVVSETFEENYREALLKARLELRDKE